MAASDATYRNTKTLNVIFAASSVVMLITIIAMFAEDYFRDWKIEQRLFYDVEEEMAKRGVLDAAPSEESVAQIKENETTLRDLKAQLKQKQADLEKNLGDLPARKLKAENEKANAKADVDSVKSLYDIAVEQHKGGVESKEAKSYKQRLDTLNPRLAELAAEVEKNQKEYDDAARDKGIPMLEAQIAELEKAHKEKLANFDLFIKTASQKQWGVGKTFRTLPIIEGFASPTKINQYTLNDLPIDYSFKYVTRYDRCTTCHLGMEKGAYTAAALAKLTDDPNRDKELRSKFNGAKEILKARREAGVKDLPADSDIEPHQIPADRLTPGRVKQFAAHPRLDLFVDPNSPHPGEKFGCTICHSGQGSATAFYEASHYPTDAATKEKWKDQYGWKPNHDWDYQMLPTRFTESGCVKCHHEITDLIRNGNEIEAPRLVKGYNLVKELGCFGCHEISGMKAGKRIGPDLRLEDDPPLEMKSPEERAKALADPLNPPGQMRKVGPNLFRVSEKTNEEWLRSWIKSPRGFRESTKMPHFYNQPNNSADVLPDDQKKFPDNEIHAIAHYLMTKSQAHIADLRHYAEEKDDARQKDADAVNKLRDEFYANEEKRKNAKPEDAATLRDRSEQIQKDLGAAQIRIKHRDEVKLVAPPVALLTLPEKADPARGRMLFQERGCLACHSHQGTEAAAGEFGGKPVPPIAGDATFAPDLSRLALKIKPQGTTKPEDARKWVVSWVMNPAAHNPRTYMPDTQLLPDQANDIAAWLLSQAAEWKPSDVERVGPADTKTLEDMAQVYLKKVLTIAEVREIFETKKGITLGRLRELQKSGKDDELELAGAPLDTFKDKKDDEIVRLDDHRLEMYVGKKAIGNLGCYACHNVPGFQSAKPIGTALNEWGKKDADRLAFEDAGRFVEHHFNVVAGRDDPKDKNKPNRDWTIKDGKKPFEQYFADMLGHHGHTREGFLALKLEEPRSYDFERLRTWDDRLRMPQFKFARPHRLPNETREAYEARTLREEAESREAVMTFILGLVAETIPGRYVSNPSGDRLNEVRGRQVLDKFNCAGCHLIQPGSTEFKFKPLFDKLDPATGGVAHPELYKHETKYPKDDYNYPEHISWAGKDQYPYDHPRVYGTGAPLLVSEDEEAPPGVQVWLMQALRFREGGKKDGKLRDMPAGAQVNLTPEMLVLGPDGKPVGSPQFGGSFMEKLVPYLQKKDKETYGGGGAKLSLAYATAPPNLVGEGERVQREWLSRFLRNPHMIRPLPVLRMPKFNMSQLDAEAIVDYFIAADRRENVGIGLTYSVPMPPREEAYQLQRTAEYVARLKSSGQYDARKKDLESYFEDKLAADRAEADKRVKDAEAALKAAPDAAKAEAQKTVDEAKKVADAAADRVKKKDVADLVKRWEEREAYVADAGRLVINNNLCLTCHSVGSIVGKENKGPNLEQAGERLRPDWTMRWVTNPNRFLHYSSVMPINFLSTKPKEHQEAFIGTSMDQIQAVRDFLMLYPEVRDWPILRARPILSGAPATPAAGGGGANK
jgi:mono/diheme cytochrome c family protein